MLRAASRWPTLLLFGVLALAACDAAPTDTILAPNGPDLAMNAMPVDIISFADGTTVMGSASLIRSPTKITVRAHMTADQGETFTVWTVVFNNPGACATSPCTAVDLGDPAVGGNVIRIAGGIAGGDGLHVSGTLREGDASEGLVPGAPPLMDAMAAEVHFIYRSHGHIIPGLIDDQTQTVGGGCSINTCVDKAFSVHVP